jgi:nitrite reductase (NADH) large subunit
MQTSVPYIYAVGDSAEFRGEVPGIIPVALVQARVAGLHIAGDIDATYTRVVPSTTLQVSGIDLTSTGEVNPEGEGFEELRYVDEERGVYKKLVIREGRIVGTILLGDRSDVAAVNRLITQHVDVSDVVGQLLEPDFDLAGYVRAQAARV